VVTVSETLAATVTVVFPSVPDAGVESVPLYAVPTPLIGTELLKSEAVTVAVWPVTVVPIVVTTFFDFTVLSFVPQKLFPLLQELVSVLGVELSVSYVGVTVAETGMLAVLRSTGDAAVTPETETDGVAKAAWPLGGEMPTNAAMLSNTIEVMKSNFPRLRFLLIF